MFVDLGLLIVRVAVGALLFGHGAQKLFGWFGGPGLASATAMMRGHLRLRPAGFWATLGSLTEVGGGLLLVAGLFGPLGSVAAVAAMLMAVTVHWPRFWAQDGGIEYPLLLLVAALGLGVAGPGAFALDPILEISFPEPLTLILGLALAVTGVGIALATRVPEPGRMHDAVEAAA